MPGWHSVELFVMPPSDRSEYYVKVPSNYENVFECGCVLTVPAQPVYANYSNVELSEDAKKSAIWQIAIMQYVVIAFLCFLAAAHDSEVDVT